MWKWMLTGALVATALISLNRIQPAEVQHVGVTASRPLDAALKTELQELRQLLGQQEAASQRQSKLLQQINAQLAADSAALAVGATAAGATPTATDASAGSVVAHAAAAAAAAQATAAKAAAATAATVAAAETKALSRCTEAEVPILKLMRSPCPDGMHGYECTERWGLNDQFLPTPSRWREEWNASARAVVNCQRGFFDALADRFTRAHWQVEWDAQPFRISAVRACARPGCVCPPGGITRRADGFACRLCRCLRGQLAR